MKLLKKFDLTPRKIIPATIAIIISSIILIIGYHFGMQLMTGISTEDGWTEEILTLEDVADEEQASLNMMLSHLKEITKDRHTTNSTEIEAVRSYLCEQLANMGYEYEIIDTSYEGKELAVLDMQHHLGMTKEKAIDEKERKSGTFKHYYSEHYKENYEGEEILPVKHILVKITPETITNEKAVLVMSHFDSVRSSVNAGNGGISVASILEAMRLLKNEKVVRPIYFWFSDGEEVSLLGAETLLNEKTELLENVEYVLNFSGYGSEGNPFLICTGENNQAMLQYLQASNTKLTAFSLFSNGFGKWGVDEYRNVLKPAGFQGLDFASIVDSKEYYNTMHDSFENLDRDYAYSTLINITELITHCATTDTKNFVTSSGETISGLEDDSNIIMFTLPLFKQVTVSKKQLQMIQLIIIATLVLLVLLLHKFTTDNKVDSNPSEFVAYIGGGTLAILLIAYIFDLTIFGNTDWSIRGYFLIPFSFTSLYLVTKLLGFKKGEVGTFWCLFFLIGALSIIMTLALPELSYPFVAAFIALNIIELFNAYTKGIARTILLLLVTTPLGIVVVSLFGTWQVIAYATVGMTLYGALFFIFMPAYGVVYHGVNAAVKSVCKEEFRPNLNPTD